MNDKDSNGLVQNSTVVFAPEVLRDPNAFSELGFVLCVFVKPDSLAARSGGYLAGGVYEVKPDPPSNPDGVQLTLLGKLVEW